MKRPLMAFLAMFLMFSARAQEDRWEFIVAHDNDFFAWYANLDRYYTYGLGGTLRRLGKKELSEDHVVKQLLPDFEHPIHEFSAQIKAYTPDSAKAGNATFDRPYAGYAYLEYKLNGQYRENNVQLGINIGMVGPFVRAGQFQNWFHKKVGDKYVSGWDYQVANYPGIHVLGAFNKPLLSLSWFNIISESDLTAGNVFIHGQQSARLVIGRMAQVSESVLYGNRLRGARKTEYFLSIAGGVRLTAINATVQGSPFNDEVPTRNLNRIAGLVQFGAHVNIRRFAMALLITHGRGEVERAYDHKYGHVSVGFTF